LQNCVNHALLRYVLVGLNAREAEWRHPLDGIAGGGNDFGALREPFFDVVGVVE